MTANTNSDLYQLKFTGVENSQIYSNNRAKILSARWLGERSLLCFQFSNFASLPGRNDQRGDPSVFHRSFSPSTVKIEVTKESILPTRTIDRGN